MHRLCRSGDFKSDLFLSAIVDECVIEAITVNQVPSLLNTHRRFMSRSHPIVSLSPLSVCLHPGLPSMGKHDDAPVGECTSHPGISAVVRSKRNTAGSEACL